MALNRPQKGYLRTVSQLRQGGAPSHLVPPELGTYMLDTSRIPLLLCVPEDDSKWTTRIDLGVTNKFQQVGKLPYMAPRIMRTNCVS